MTPNDLGRPRGRFADPLFLGSASAKRQAAEVLVKEHGLSIGRACRVARLGSLRSLIGFEVDIGISGRFSRSGNEHSRSISPAGISNVPIRP